MVSFRFLKCRTVEKSRLEKDGVGTNISTVSGPLLMPCLTALLVMMAPAAIADGPGRGQTADFEKAYLQFIIDHHYSALRMTELAAGTDLQRDAAIDNPQEGTAPTPNTNPTTAKSTDDQIKFMSGKPVTT
jgi:hypothetical protein